MGEHSHWNSADSNYKSMLLQKMLFFITIIIIINSVSARKFYLRSKVAPGDLF